MIKSIKGAILVLSVVLTGCASLGHDEYGCKGMPSGSTCMSTVDIYQATNRKDDLEVAYADEEKESESGWFSSDKEKEADAKPADPDPEILSKIRSQQRYIDSLVPDAAGTVPILKSAEVLRFWVADHETSNGQWNGESFHFVQITPRKWSTGQVHETSPEVFHPIQVIKPKTQAKN